MELNLPSHIQMRLQRFEAAMRYVQQLGTRINLKFDQQLKDTEPASLILAMDRATKAVEPFIRKVIMRHYQESTLGTHTKKANYVHTGWIKAAINQISVRMAIKPIHGTRYFLPTIKIVFPTKVLHGHVAMASLNWGAVHAPKSVRAVFDLPQRKVVGYSNRPIVGRAAKRSLKKFAYTGKISKRAKGRIERGSKFYGTQVTPGVKLSGPTGRKDRKSIEIGSGMKVRTPFPFFYFTQMDIGAISSGWNQALMKELGYAS